MSIQERVSLASPGQLLLRWDAVGFWQVLVRVRNPEPHVEVQAVHPDHDVQPTAPGAIDVVCIDYKHELYLKYRRPYICQIVN